MRAADVDPDRYPRLYAALDPLATLSRLANALAVGLLPREYGDTSKLTLADLPTHEALYSYTVYGTLIDQLEPKGTTEQFTAAVIAVGILGDVEPHLAPLKGRLPWAFCHGLRDGIEQTDRRGCHIDEVEAMFRNCKSGLNAYVAGWDLGKTKRLNRLEIDAA